MKVWWYESLTFIPLIDHCFCFLYQFSCPCFGCRVYNGRDNSLNWFISKWNDTTYRQNWLVVHTTTNIIIVLLEFYLLGLNILGTFSLWAQMNLLCQKMDSHFDQVELMWWEIGHCLLRCNEHHSWGLCSAPWSGQPCLHSDNMAVPSSLPDNEIIYKITSTKFSKHKNIIYWMKWGRITAEVCKYQTLESYSLTTVQMVKSWLIGLTYVHILV